MFAAKNSTKIDSLSKQFCSNKLKLDQLMSLDPFEMTDFNGLHVFKYPEFEPYQKVIASLTVIDEQGNILNYQSTDLRNSILKTAIRQTFIEMLYEDKEPSQSRYLSLLEEKLLLDLVNLVLEDELPLNKTLTRKQITLAEATFKDMLQKAQNSSSL